MNHKEVENSLYQIARDEAVLTLDRHDYLPNTQDEADKFWPHEWVMSALRRAYYLGSFSGKRELRAEFQALLGIASIR